MKYERNEYPRPQFRRNEWTNLNGEWEFEFDDNNDGVKRGLYNGKATLKNRINVPFSYQYPASGIGDNSQHDIVWYLRRFEAENGKRALLCFNAADYETDVWINGKHAVKHRGGFAPFKADITELLEDGENVIVVRCSDGQETFYPRGKQNWRKEPFSCFYVPNTGIWQSVWIEYFGNDCVDAYCLLPDVDNRSITGEIQTLYGKADRAIITVSFKNEIIKKQTISLDGRLSQFSIKLADNDHFMFADMLWYPDKPNLLEIEVELLSNNIRQDFARTRIGLRKISVEGGYICVNSRRLYQRLVLDQGYWQEGGLTPPSAEALKNDIEQSKAMGFNGARKHQKFEDPYYYYYAEELGFLTWCEMPSAYKFCAEEVQAIVSEWTAIVREARNFTSNICYVPLNESWGVSVIKADVAQQRFAKALYYLTKCIDGTRLISTNDGWENIEESDIISIHDYNIKQSGEFPLKYKHGEFDGLNPQGWQLFADGHKYKGQPVLLTEFGGLAFAKEQKGSAWGYGNGVKDNNEFYERLKQLIDGISLTEFQGYCYTQLTDVQQEINGLLYADHTPKVDINRLKEIFERYDK